MKSIWILALASFLTGCTKFEPPIDFKVSSAIAHRIDKEVQWNDRSYHDERVSNLIETLLQQELDHNSAVQIALLNNPKIQETFEEIGIAEADLIESGLLSNPVFDFIFRQKGDKTKSEYTVALSFIDLFLIPLRQKVARDELEQTMLRVTNQVLDIAFDVEQTIYELQGAEEDLKNIKARAELSSIAAEIALRQHHVGNINRLELEQTQAKHLEAELLITLRQNDILHLQEKLNRLLGFRSDVEWKLVRNLPEIEDVEPSLEDLESCALQERLDLQVARDDVTRLKGLLKTKQWWVYTKGHLGVSGERDVDGTDLIGPALSGEIPLFNYGQADRLRIRAMLRKSQEHLKTLEIEVLSEVREAYKRLALHLKTINDYQNHLFPLQKKTLESSIALYNVMGLGIDRLLEIKQQDYHVESNYAVSLSNYWIARSQLDRALGGKLRLARKISPEKHAEGPFEEELQPKKEALVKGTVITPNVGSLPWTMDGDVKVFHLIAEPIRREFAPGFWVNCWGYNGSSPGPTIEAVEGDRVRILVTNKLNEPTTIHWHGIILPNGMDGVSGLNQKGIPPGDTFKYEFTLKQNGTFMYHSHADEMTQVALGMEGFFIIHPKDGENPPIDRDFAIFLHEWNIPMGAKTPIPTEMVDFNVFTFNSALYPNIESLVVKTGDRVRIRFGNAMMGTHPIHLHGHEFTVTRRGGKKIPLSAQYSEVTVLVASGETRDIEFIADNPGDWAIHCHKTHHTMNQMKHALPNLTGINKEGIEERIRKFFPDFMGLMNINGMGEMFDMYGTGEKMDMAYPPNLAPIGSPGPFGVIEMGGMFTILKVRDHLTTYTDPGWYEPSAGD